MNPYCFDLESEYPEAFGSFQLPVAVVMVTVNGEFCCNGGISSDGILDVLLPDDTYRELRSGVARMFFRTFAHTPGEAGQLEAIEIVDVELTDGFC